MPDQKFLINELELTFGFDDPAIYVYFTMNCPNLRVYKLTNVTGLQFRILSLAPKVRELTAHNHGVHVDFKEMTWFVLGVMFDGEPIDFPRNKCTRRFLELRKIHLITVMESRLMQEQFLFMLSRIIPTLKMIESNMYPVPMWSDYVLRDTELFEYPVRELSFESHSINDFVNYKLKDRFPKLRGICVRHFSVTKREADALAELLHVDRIHMKIPGFKLRNKENIEIMVPFLTKLTYLTFLHIELSSTIAVRDLYCILLKAWNLQELFIDLSEECDKRFIGSSIEDKPELELEHEQLRIFKYVGRRIKGKDCGAILISYILKFCPNVEYLHIEASQTFFKRLVYAFRADGVELKELATLTIGLEECCPTEVHGQIYWLLKNFRGIRILYVVENERLLRSLQRTYRYNDITILSKLRDPEIGNS